LTSKETAYTCAVSVAVLMVVGGPAIAQSSSTSANAQRPATISVIPQTSRVCPGQSIDAKYVEHLPDGSEVNLPARDVRQVSSSDADAATMGRDGSWQTAADPMRSVLSGFRLSVSLVRDTLVRGDTVVVPKYDCPRTDIRLPPSRQFQATHAYVRLGTFPTPFYDSVVVAVIELESRVVGVAVLSPSEMRSGVIRAFAPGRDGASGRNGRPGTDGVDCSNGDDGEDGEAGEPGQPGGQVDIITQQGSPWLATLVAVSNPGGRGGAGGSPGRGGGVGVGRAASSGRTSGRCTARPGRTGKPGRSGAVGAAGDDPRVTSVITPLLWRGSPIWSDAAARRAIEGLMAYEAKR
jgi:hypothetical protein